MILCFVVYELNVLRLSTRTTNIIRKFVLEKEHRRQEFMSYLVHIEQCRDIHLGPKAFVNLCQRLKGNVLV